MKFLFLICVPLGISTALVAYGAKKAEPAQKKEEAPKEEIIQKKDTKSFTCGNGKIFGKDNIQSLMSQNCDPTLPFSISSDPTPYQIVNYCCISK